MNLSLTLDYELFFGRRSGSVERCVVEPTQALCALARRHGVPLVLFVDAVWLLRLRELSPRHPHLGAELAAVLRQLEACVRAGHELQLHLHPHWLDTHWSADGWQVDLRRYRLHAFADAEIAQIVHESTALLRSLAGARAVRAFRAGGWCIQPFERLLAPLAAAGIVVDSTVYAGGHQHDEAHAYDFRDAPALSRWRFDDDPLHPVAEGRFVEVPIASHPVGPWLYWRLAAARKLGLAQHRPAGDGAAVALGCDDLVAKLTRTTASVVSFDGLKASLLEPAWRRYRALGREDFVVIGHPKALTRHALDTLDAFCAAHAGESFGGLERYADAAVQASTLQAPQRRAA